MSPKGPRCHLCRRYKFDKERDPTEHFCSGCNQYICDDCDHNLSLMGPHEPEEHLEYNE